MHIHHMKRLFILVLAFVVLMSLGACAQPTAPSEEIDLTEEEPAPPDEGVNGVTPEATSAATEVATEEVTEEGPTDEPVAGETLAETLASDAQLAAFSAMLLQAANNELLADVDLSGASFTLFVPSNEVFAATTISAEDATALTSDAAAAQEFFLCYIAEGMMSQGDMAQAGTITTVGGDTITVTGEPGDLTINGEFRIVAEIATSNGVIYVIDGLLCPVGGE